MKSLEKILGYKFSNPLLLAEALTHPSLAYETQKPRFDNQRLEFLGDAVIQLVLTGLLYEMFPEFNEGKLTKLRARLVSGQALSKFARDMDLGSYMMMGKGEESSGGRDRVSTLADAFEALMGAIYVDSGLEQAREVITRMCSAEVSCVADSPEEKNPKGQLQEILQAISHESPVYKVVAESGPDHQKRFHVRVIWRGVVLGTGEGGSKKEAEIDSASDALQKHLWGDSSI
jgi:ribonuclease-3